MDGSPEQDDTKLDSVLVRLGSFGPYQRRVVLLVALVSFSTAFNNLGYAFWAARPAHSCRASGSAAALPGRAGRGNASGESWLVDHTQPLGTGSQTWLGSDDVRRSQCHTCDVTSPQLLAAYNSSDDSSASNYTCDEMVECSEWTYDRSRYVSTIVTEWNLVCSRRWLVSATQSVYMGGRIAGTVIYGHLADRFGRRATLLAAILLQLLCSTSCALVSDIYAFLVLRFLLGIQTTGEFQTAYLIATEMVGPSWRVVAGTIMQLYWAAAYMALAGVAYLLRARTPLQLALSLPLVALLGIVYCFIPETPRWLLAKGKIKDCEQILRRLAICNGTTLEERYVLHLKAEVKTVSGYSFIDLFKTKNIRRTTILLLYSWFVNSFVFYGLSLGGATIAPGGNEYLSFFLAGLVEVPANLACLAAFQRCGRPRPFALALLLAGGALGALAVVPLDLTPARLALGLVGKAAITCSYAMVYLYTAEAYPTVVRGVGLAAGAMFARLGGVVAPLAAELSQFWTPLPLLLFGCLAALAGCSALLLPETKDRPLAQSVEEGEMMLALPHSPPPPFCCFRMSKKQKPEKLPKTKLNEDREAAAVKELGYSTEDHTVTSGSVVTTPC